LGEVIPEELTGWVAGTEGCLDHWRERLGGWLFAREPGLDCASVATGCVGRFTGSRIPDWIALANVAVRATIDHPSFRFGKEGSEIGVFYLGICYILGIG